jgi:hypothetical protein
VDEAAEAVASVDLRSGLDGRGERPFGGLTVEGSVRSLLVVVLDVDVEHVA